MRLLCHRYINGGGTLYLRRSLVAYGTVLMVRVTFSGNRNDSFLIPLPSFMAGGAI
jgi:hypothetical protein